MAAACGLERVIGGVIYASCTTLSPGLVRIEGAPGQLVLGEAMGQDRARTHALAEAFLAGGMPARAGKLRWTVWDKLAGNIGSGLPAVLTGRPMRDAADDGGGAAVIRALVAETAAIAQALGHDIPADGARLLERMRASSHVPSIAQDLTARRLMEVATQFEAPVALAAALGVDVPVLRALTALARLRAGPLAG